MKRLLDLVVASTLLLILSPVLVVVAIGVRLSVGAPVLFRQERAGRGGKPFTLLKFRTMHEPVPGHEGPEHDVARTSRWGTLLRRTSIDELPSLLNVILGDMSLVGPRPLPLVYIDRYTPTQARRLEVLPGLTGWAVVNGRNQLAWDDRFELDCWYVDHRSFALDLRILARTVSLVVRGDSVNHAPHLTMSEFRGVGTVDGNTE